MRLRLPGRDEHRESGAIAIMMALLAVVVFGAAALAVDITSQVNQRQKLHDTIDAAALAGAYRLPALGSGAEDDARANALKNDPTLSLPRTPVDAVTFFCVVASLSAGVPGLVDNSQIPATCNPLSARRGSSPNYTWTGSRCNTTICSIPCNPAATPGDVCNSISVTGTKPVPFSFGRVIGVNQGGTGSVTSVACLGSCGTTAPNPMDVAVVADRTVSMRATDVTDMITGIESMFQEMTPSQQYVALGTIGRSKLNPTTCTSEDATPDNSVSDGGNPARGTPSTNHETVETGGGPWMPEAFSNNYLTTGTTNINGSSTLIKALECLKNNQNSYTHLAAPMKAAARLLMGKSTAPETLNNVGSLLPARTTTSTPQKVLIFETDGVPYESGTTGGTTDLNVSGDIYSNNMDVMSVGTGSAKRWYFNGGDVACQNLVAQAAAAKAAGILVITIAYNLSGQNCDSSDHYLLPPSSPDGKTAAKAYDFSKAFTPRLALDILASAAQEKSPGVPSVADSDCSTAPERTAENSDNDYFFCAASGDDMKTIFKTALSQVLTGIRLIKMP
jgi:Putative Flp pilus-assembly TadE/G-like